MRRRMLGALKGLVIGGGSLACAACGSSGRVAGVALGVSVASSAGAAGNVDLVRFPALSPDGSQIVFTCGATSGRSRAPGARRSA